jgi:hypothetical protein
MSGRARISPHTMHASIQLIAGARSHMDQL